MKLSEKILIYIGYCLKDAGFKFSHQKMAEVFRNACKSNYYLTTLRKEFSNLKRAGFINYKTRYHRPVPILTRKGKLRITPRLPYRKFGHWDGKWRLIIFEMPEKEKKYRLILAQKMKELGFQKIQAGVYISPYPLLGTINRLAAELGVRQYLNLIEAEKIDREKWSIEQIWELEKINQKYQRFIAQTAQAQKRAKEKFWVFQAKQIEEEFSEIYCHDPHLPKGLLPKDWLGDEAYQVYKKIVHSY